MWEAIYPWVVGGLGGCIGAALLLPTKLGEALFQFRFNKALEAFKAEQTRELETLKENLNHVSDRGRRSNEMEFAAIETVWRGFVKAWLSTNTCIGAITSIPRFSSISEDDIKSFASASGLSPQDQKTFLASADREKEYLTLISWRRVSDAETDIYQARLTLREQRIFMPAELTKEFGDVIERMSGAQVERRLSLESPHIRASEFGKASTEWLADCLPVFERMAKVANERLFRQERRQDEIVRELNPAQ